MFNKLVDEKLDSNFTTQQHIWLLYPLEVIFSDGTQRVFALKDSLEEGSLQGYS